MFRPDAGFAMRVARTVLVPFGPLIVTVVLGSWAPVRMSESVFGWLILLAMAWFFCSLILVPALLFRAESPPGSSTDDHGDGRDGPQEPPSRDPGPGGVPLPLPDAEQSSERVRDHVRRDRSWPLRRTAREPEPTPNPKVYDKP